MNSMALFTLLLVASSLSAIRSSEAPSSQGEAPVSIVPGQSPPVVQSAPVVVSGPQPGSGIVVEAHEGHPHQHSHAEHQLHHAEQQHHQQQHQHGVAIEQHPSGQQVSGGQPPMVGYYSPAGMIQVVGGEQQVGAGGVKPVGVRNFEQFGQPESASLPPNYKPFGSWGLYIGGNPADGYYTNYYKALSNSVDKQVVGSEQQVAGAGAGVAKPQMASQTAAFSPMLRQAVGFGSSNYAGDYYPFAYSPSDLNSGRVDSMVQSVPHSSLVQGAQVYSSSLAPEPSFYASSYATKKLGQQAIVQREVKEPQYVSPAVVQQQQQQQQVKGYQPQSPLAYAYHQGVPSQMVAPQHHQVVAYPVPVGSQIVGSQQGVDGAFNPYGVHAFTRYAIKPTVVSSDQSYYYSVPVGQFPAYKQQSVSPASSSSSSYSPVGSSVSSSSSSPVSPASIGYQPLGFYGYPLNQLHYSQGSIVPSGAHGYQQHQQHQAASFQPSGEQAPVVHHHSPSGQVEAASSEKSETEDKSVVSHKQPQHHQHQHQQQKRA